MNSTNTALLDDKLSGEKTYWLEKFAGEPHTVGIPLDHKRPAVFDGARNSVMIQIDPETEARLREVCGNKEALMFTVLVAVLKICLHKYTGETDIIIGTAIHERYAEVASFNKVLALRDEVRPDQTVKQLLQAVKRTFSEAYANQKYPFARLVKLLNIETSGNRAPLVNVVAILDTAGNKENVRHLMSDATLVYTVGDGRVMCAIEYNPNLFLPETIEIFGRHLQTILRAVLDDSDVEVSQVELLSDERKHELLVKFNATQRVYRNHETISRLFEEQVERTPDHIAVTFGERHVTCQELNLRANRLAHRLRGEGIKPGALVGICLEHSIETLVAILGVLKAGGGYVPLDPRHPKARLAFVFTDAAFSVLLTEQSLLGILPDNDSKVICLDTEWEMIERESAENPTAEASAGDIAYVIYTSGSTGDPKGVAVSHRSLVNYTQWASQVYVQNEWLAFALYSSLAFDLTVTSIYTPLITGNRIIIYRQEGRESALFDILRDNQVEVLKLTPSHLALIKDGDHSTSRIKRLIVGGEAFDTEVARRIYESFGGKVEVLNEYGPTEATVGCMLHQYDPESDRRAFVPIGKPAANTQIYILDENLKPVAENVTGELYISGDGLAAGYLNKEELTQARFIANPFIPDQKMYRSGDLARWLPEGNIEYAGRRDEQVKFHGYRVELNEIRSALNSHAQVSESVIIVLKDKNDYDVMLAFYVSGQELEATQLHAFLSQRLVEETIPNIFLHLQKLPLTLNGKVDMRALPSLEAAREQLKRDFVAARNPVEEMLAGAWGKLLGLEQVSIHDNFFELGGHSLLATQLFSRIRETLNVELPLRILFESPTIAEFAERLEAAKRSGAGMQAPPLKPVPRDRNFPLSFAQQRLWFIDQLVPGSTFYNVSSSVRLQGKLNISALERTITEVTRRHEVLRTTFPMVDGEPAQVFAPVQPLELPVTDLSELTEQEREEELQKLLAEHSMRPFNLSLDSLLRVSLVRLGEDNHAVILVTHHIVCDGWSMGVLIKEVSAIYKAYSLGEPSPLEELSLQYADFAVWQREWLQGEALEQQLSYWREQLKDAPPVLELPTDRPRPALQSYKGASHTFRVPAEVSAGLKALSRGEGATLFMTLLAAFKVLLSRYSGQTDIVVGTPIAGRNRSEIEPLIGFFVNTLVMRTDLSGAPSFREVLRQVRETALEAYAHENLPFEKIVEVLNPERALSHTPLVQVVFGFQSLLENKATDVSDLTMSSLGNESGTARFDVVQNMFETEQGLTGSLHCNTDLFNTETIRRISGHFQQLLHSIVEQPDAAISSLPLLSEEDSHQQLIEWNDTAVDYPDQFCFHQLLEQQVQHSPNAIAATCEGRSLTYSQLNRRANRLAHLLVERGADREVVVALLAERDLDLLVAILAVFKAGAAYLPLDPGFPAGRLGQVLAQSATPLVLATSRHQQLLEHALAGLNEERRPAVLQIDHPFDSADERGQASQSDATEENLPPRNSPASLAYVIYTSGSTGVPKGAMIEQRGMLNHLFAKVRDLALTDADKVAQTASQSFDISVWQMLAALLVGAEVEFFPDAVAHDARRLLAEAERAGVTILETVPSLLRAMLDEAESSSHLSTLRWMIPTGEALPPELCRRWLKTFPHVPLLNAYGPTECSDDVSHYCIDHPTAAEVQNISIGRPIGNMRLYIVDQQMRALPVGVRGELCVGGVGVGRGYLREPARTAESFVPDVFGGEGERLYRTGDLARFLPDGNIEFLGRIDNQVKLRGFRIELGEIEVALRESEEVADALAMVREDVPGSLRLVAYVVWTVEAGAEIERLQSRLKDRLPEYMVPTAFISLTEMPLTPNGKVDRRALPAPEQPGADSERSFVAPRTPLEQWLAEKWAKALSLNAEQIGVEDSFFDLGGDSIRAAIIVNRVQDALGEVVHVVTILDAPTVAGFAAFLEGRYAPAIARVLGSAGVTLAAEQRGAGAQVFVTESKVEQLRELSAGEQQRVAPLGAEESVKKRGGAGRSPVLFVLSPPRSGSTLLRVLLGGHTRLFAPPELELLGFRDMRQRRDALSGRDKFWLEGALRAVMQARGCEAEQAQAIIDEYEARRATTTEFYGDLQSWIGAKHMLVDKSPSYALELDVLRRAEREFEGARYIHLVRRPEAVIHSFEGAHMEQIFPRFAHPFSGREVAELVWVISQQNILKFLEEVSTERQHRVVFEELVGEPRRVIEGVCEFLDVEFDEQMMKPYAEREKRMTDGIRAESKMLGDVKFHEHRGIEAGVGERWREAVAGGMEISKVTKDLAVSLGYVVQGEEGRSDVQEANTPAPIGAQRQSLTPIRPVDEKAGDGEMAVDISLMSDQEVEAMLESVLAGGRA